MTLLRAVLAVGFALALSGVAARAQPISAVLEPVQYVEIRSAVAGRIAELAQREGDTVAQGALLARIDARVQEARVTLARTAADAQGAVDRAAIVVAQAEGLFDRVSTARSKGAAQPWEVTQARQALDLARADQRIAQETADRLAAQLALEEATLAEFAMRAPFDGTVLDVPVEQGQIVDTQTTVAAFGNLDRLRATAFLPVDWVTALSVGDRLDARVQGLDDTLRATVTLIDPRIDPASQSLRIRVEVANPDQTLFAGAILLLERP